MSHWKASGLAIFAVVCLLGGTVGSARAECIPNDICATEWSNGSVIELRGFSNFIASEATSINDVGQAVGVSIFQSVTERATEWSGGKIINLEFCRAPRVATPSA
jgi:hypothetical protein